MNAVAATSPPAKLNLFLELLAKRPDGYHEIDTVMVPIDWCDELQLTRHSDPGISLSVRWLPSEQEITDRLGVGVDVAGLMKIPRDSENLVHRALTRFQQAFDVEGGFCCQLGKRIPAGAGMGGASSDAGSALRCAAALCGIDPDEPALRSLAEQLGSDVPFFLGLPGVQAAGAVRAQGRGERLQSLEISTPIDFVVVFPAISLSTAKVYAEAQVPDRAVDSRPLAEVLSHGRTGELGKVMLNRLTEPAKKLAPQIAGVLESLWRVGLRTCQLTGSGSACFAVASSPQEAQRCADALRVQLEPGAIVMAARSSHVPGIVNVT